MWAVPGGMSCRQPGHTEPMRELFPRMTQVTLKRAGHWVHADEPAAFVELCRAFLGRVF